MAQGVQQILEALQKVKAEKVAGFQDVLDQEQQWLAQQIADRKAFLSKLRPRVSTSDSQRQPPATLDGGPARESAQSRDKVQ